MGWFTTIFPVRIDLSGVDPGDAFAGGPAAGVAAKTVKEQLRAVPDRGIGFGLLRYLNRETAHTLSQLPVPQISFNYLGRVGGSDADASAGWVPIRDEDLRTVAAVDLPLASVLEVNVMTVDSDTEDGPQLVAGWTFPPDILGADDVRQLGGQWWLDALAGLGEFAAGGGGFTPSDFDLVDLRQEAIDDLESRCPDLSDVWPLSPLQAGGLLFHAELAERSVDAYLVQVALDLAGAVDSERLRRAADALLGRYENLRTAFLHSADGRAVQVVRSNVAAPWQEIDLTGAPDQEIDRALAEDRARPFDMARAPLIRFTLIALAPEKFTLVLTNHHILLDGWSMPPADPGIGDALCRRRSSGGLASRARVSRLSDLDEPPRSASFPSSLGEDAERSRRTDAVGSSGSIASTLDHGGRVGVRSGRGIHNLTSRNGA